MVPSDAMYSQRDVTVTPGFDSSRMAEQLWQSEYTVSPGWKSAQSGRLCHCSLYESGMRPVKWGSLYFGTQQRTTWMPWAVIYCWIIWLSSG